MGRPLRHVPPHRTVEVTNRTFQARYLLLPTANLRRIVLGTLGRVQRKLEMPIHGFTFASNHFHLILSPRDARHLAQFMRRFEQKLSTEITRLYDWKGPLWQDRYHHIEIEDDEAALLDRLRYVLSHGVKEGLVAHSAEWPGANCVSALAEGTELVGTWYDRTAEYNARRRGHEVDEEDFGDEEHVNLTPLPCWAHLTEAERQELVRGLVADIEEKAAAAHRDKGTRPVGVRKVLAHHPWERPKRAKNSPRPWFHAATREGWLAMREAYQAFAAAFHDAAELLRSGGRNPSFPEGSFPPGRPFVPHQAPG